MFVVTGVTGQTGSHVAASLLERGAAIRVVVRRAAAGGMWKERGAAGFVADLRDEAGMTEALKGAEGAYLMNPPAYGVEMFADAEEVARAFAGAIGKASPRRVVVLSSVGAHLERGTGNIRTANILERTLASFAQVSFVRAAWFMENWKFAFSVAAKDGVVPTFLAPAERALPMVAARDIGHLVAEVMTGSAPRAKIVELEGPRVCSPLDVANAFGHALHRAVDCVVVSEASWDDALRPMQMHSSSVEAWKEMLRGFNTGHITFEQPEHAILRGVTTPADFAASLAKEAP